MNTIYQYIYKQNNKYLIRKGGVIFGRYSNLNDALSDRDILVSVGWDFDCFVDSVPLSLYDVSVCDFGHDFLRYISVRGVRVVSFRVRKRVGGVVVVFGVFDCLCDAVWWRDYCVVCWWSLDCRF